MPATAPIEFVEPDDDGAHAEHLPAQHTRARRPTVLIVSAALVALCVAVAVVHTDPPARPHGGATSTPLPAASTSPAVAIEATTPAAPPDPVHRVASEPIAVAAAAACVAVAGCSVVRDRELARAARRALGRTVDLEVRSVTPGRALIVSALSPSGARLLVLVTAPSLQLDVTRLHIRPPFGVQSQHNGADNVLAVASGSTASVALLSRPAVQLWLGRLHPTG